jgi:hypothetical protein
MQKKSGSDPDFVLARVVVLSLVAPAATQPLFFLLDCLGARPVEVLRARRKRLLLAGRGCLLLALAGREPRELRAQNELVRLFRLRHASPA